MCWFTRLRLELEYVLTVEFTVGMMIYAEQLQMISRSFTLKRIQSLKDEMLSFKPT
jgi:hypothetical protein